MNRYNSGGLSRNRKMSALERRKKDLAFYAKVLADKDAPQAEREEANAKFTAAQVDITNLEAKLSLM